MAKNERLRTSGFLGIAMAMLAAAGFTYWMNQPPKIDGFELVGQEFFGSFTESSQATSLKVVAMNPDAKLQEFRVQRVDGLWTIPSHYNYPAEAIERLATTSASVIGLERETLVGRLKSEHEKFGVVDPTSESATDPETTGQRLTLRDDDDNILADLIIGKPAGAIEVDQSAATIEADRPTNYYYVRRADEAQTFKVPLRIGLSTRFSDWIDPDLLRLNPETLTTIKLDNYEIQERAGDILGQTKQIAKIEGEQISLSRDPMNPGSGWNMETINAESEIVNLERVNQIAATLKNLRIVGVRPKTTLRGKQVLTADLQINTDPEIRADPAEFEEAITQLQFEMGDKGFNLMAKRTPHGRSELFFLCKKGELELGTAQGVNYTLMLGNEVEGDEKAIEIGGVVADADPDNTATDGESKTPADNPSDSSNNRYLVVRVNFDESLLGTKPVKPTEPDRPIAPEGYSPPKAESDSLDQQSNQQDNDAPKPDESESDQEAESDPEKRPAEFLAHDKALEIYDSAKVEYELSLAQYNQQLEAWDVKVVEGKQLANELHERFGKWYYVVSADNLDTIQASRSNLITKISSPKPVELPESPDISFEVDENKLEQRPAGDAEKESDNQDSDSAKKETEANQG